MKILAGLPTLIAVGGLLYVTAESGSRWIALVVSAGLFCGLLVSLRAEARRLHVEAGAEARRSSRSEKASSAMHS